MKLYLLSCQTIEQHVDRILPLLSGRRREAYQRTHSPLSLGAGLLLAAVLNVHADEDLVFGPQGKPYLAAGKPSFSLSHSRDRVLLGVSEHPIGVDMEPRNRPISPAVQKRTCLPQEVSLDPLQVFTRKECAMKLTGLGFSLPLQQIDTTAPFCWKDETFFFLTTEQEGYLISVLSTEKEFPTIHRLSPEELL